MHISHDDFLLFIDRALDGMLHIVEELGDERAHRRPALPGANSPYAILTHCVGVAHYWIGARLAHRHISRDRDAEFRAQGTGDEIRRVVRTLQRQLREDIRHVRGEQPLVSPPASSYTPMGYDEGWTQGAALLHAYEELAQHHGQIEITRDILLDESTAGSPAS
jgi:Protein of unknown function (DUF664)